MKSSTFESKAHYSDYCCAVLYAMSANCSLVKNALVIVKNTKVITIWLVLALNAIF